MVSKTVTITNITLDPAHTEAYRALFRSAAHIFKSMDNQQVQCCTRVLVAFLYYHKPHQHRHYLGNG
jgi:hypothetical protein